MNYDNAIEALKRKGAKDALEKACLVHLVEAKHRLEAAWVMTQFRKSIQEARKAIEQAEKIYEAWKTLGEKK